MKSEPNEFKFLLKTGERHLFDAADLALEEAGIHHNLEAYDATGIRDQIHADHPTPGSSWAILVPKDRHAEAQAVIDQLPWDFGQRRDTWDCCDPATPVTKRWLVVGVWCLIAIVVLLLVTMLRSFFFNS